jgi:hypothetical protein
MPRGKPEDRKCHDICMYIKRKEKDVEKEKEKLAVYVLMKVRMKESGSLDLKALRKDHILPMKGQPKSPGGSEYCFSPSWASYNHQFTFFRIHFPTPNPPNMTARTTQIDPDSIAS